MFAGVLNKGIRGGIGLLLLIVSCYSVILLFSLKNLETSSYPDLFYNYFLKFVNSKYLILLVNLISLTISLVLVSSICTDEEIVDKNNFFPFFLYAFLSLVSLNASQINSQLITNVFILYTIKKLVASYRKEHALNQIFLAAFWLSLSAFFTMTSIVAFPLFFIVLVILRNFSLKEWVVALIGFAAPIFIYECIAYLINFNRWYFIQAFKLYFNSLTVPSFSEYYLPLLFLLLILLLVSIVAFLFSGFGNTIKKQKMNSLLLWYIFFSIFGFFSGGANSSKIILIYCFPISVFVGEFMFLMKQQKITNTIITLLLFCLSIIAGAMYNLV